MNKHKQIKKKKIKGEEIMECKITDAYFGANTRITSCHLKEKTPEMIEKVDIV